MRTNNIIQVILLLTGSTLVAFTSIFSTSINNPVIVIVVELLGIMLMLSGFSLESSEDMGEGTKPEVDR